MTSSTSLRVCVFGSSSKQTPEAYLKESYKLGKLIAKGGHVCVTGGGVSGCMGAVSDGCADAGGTAVGVIHEMWCAEGEMDEKHRRLSELIKVGGKNLMRRKEALLERADCFVSLPGGVGTFDELCEVVCEKQLGMNPRVCVLLNIDGYYDGFLQQMKRMQKDKILYVPTEKLILTATTAEEALELCVKHHAENQNLKINTDENMKAVEKKKKKTEEKAKEEGQTGGNGEKIEINEKEDVVRAAIEARAQSLKLQALDTAGRRAILLEIAKTLAENKNEILEVNKEDIKAAQSMKMSKSMRKRLVMDAKKIENLCKGITQIANDEDPIGQLVSATELSKKLILHQKTVPIGVLLIIFESRPDCLPQIAALSIKSGNGLLLKGGKEARMSCRFLHKLITQAVEKATKGKVSSGVVSLVETRQEIAQLLSLDHVIDLVIPRGSYGLVNFIKSHTKIPVLGHADGICHIFLDADLDVAMAIRLIIDAKLNYAAACNAVENVLFHEGLFEDGRAGKILAAVRKEGIQVHASKEISQLLGKDTTCAAIPADTGFSTEYGDNRMSIHVVKNVSAAMRHINEFGSGHTDCIVTNNKDNVEAFLTGVASACVFHNASTRFADGFRFGLGAEVGISTGKIHARGPVGVKGLTTTQWTLASGEKDGHTVTDFVEGACEYTHKKLELKS